MMKPAWFVRVAREHAAQVARLREVAGLQVAESADALWVRAAAGGDALDRQLAGLGGERFVLAPPDLLVPWDKRVPTERLPRLTWLAIAAWAEISLPVAALPAQPGSRLRLRLVRGGAEATAAAILVDWHRWLEYATSAPEVRLRPLAFALSADRRVFVCGAPLPPVLGQHYAVNDGIAVACGWTLFPAVGSQVVRRLLNLAAGDVALFSDAGAFERIGGEHFVRASRSAVRASAREGA